MSKRYVIFAAALSLAAGVGALSYSQLPPSYARTPATFAAGHERQECRGFKSDDGPIYPSADIEKRLPPGFAFGIRRSDLLPRLRAAGSPVTMDPIDYQEEFGISPNYSWLNDFSRATGLKPIKMVVSYSKTHGYPDDFLQAHAHRVSITFERTRFGLSPMNAIIRHLGKPTSGSYSRSCDPMVDDISYLTAPESQPQFGIAASDCVRRNPQRSSCVMSKAVTTCALKPRNPNQLVMNVRSGVFKEGIRIEFVDLRQSAPLISGELPDFTTAEHQPLSYCEPVEDPTKYL